MRSPASACWHQTLAEGGPPLAQSSERGPVDCIRGVGGPYSSPSSWKEVGSGPYFIPRRPPSPDPRAADRPRREQNKAVQKILSGGRKTR